MQDKLTDSAHNQIFQQQICREFLDSLSPNPNPKAILLAGQPGAGKNGMCAKAKAELGECVVADPDDLRRFHPRYAEYQQTHPNKASFMVQPDASKWAVELRQAAIAKGVNVLVDGTLRIPDAAAEMAKELKKEHYRVEVHAIAVSDVISEEGVRHRFEQVAHEQRELLNRAKNAREQGKNDLARQLNEQAATIIPRNVGMDFQELAFDGMQATIERIQNELLDSKLVDRCAVFDRGNTTLADSANGQDVLEALKEKREAQMSTEEAEQYNKSRAESLQWKQERATDTRERAVVCRAEAAGRSGDAADQLIDEAERLEEEAERLEEEYQAMQHVNSMAFLEFLQKLDRI